MNSVVSSNNNLINITLAGQIDLNEVHQLSSSINEILNKDEQSFNILVDMTMSPKFSPDAITALSAFYNDVSKRLLKILLVIPDPVFSELTRVNLEQNNFKNFVICRSTVIAKTYLN